MLENCRSYILGGYTDDFRGSNLGVGALLVWSGHPTKVFSTAEAEGVRQTHRRGMIEDFVFLP